MKDRKKTGNSEVAVVSEGQRRLREVEATNAEVSIAVDVSKAAVGHWRTGHKVPSRTQRQRLLQLYAIPVEAWDTRVGKTLLKNPEKAKSSLAPSYALVRMAKASMAEVDELLADIRSRRADAGMMVSEQAKFLAVEVQALALKSRLERGLEDLETQYWESPQGKRLLKHLIEALAPHPAAAAAVEEVLAAVAS